VDAGAEGDVRVVPAGHVQPVRVGERGRVAVGRAEQQGDLAAPRYRHTVDLDVLEDPPLEHLQRGVEAHELLHRGTDEMGVCS